MKGEKCSGSKDSKVRLTGMAAASAAGEKLPIFVIDKSAKPRCFKHVKSLPCYYRSQVKNCMNSLFFDEWLQKLETQPMEQGVIRSLKGKYRKNIIQRFIRAEDMEKAFPKTSILDAIPLLTYT